MSEKKIVVPEGMRHAVALALLHVFGETNYHPQIPVVLEAALRWLSENPIVPSDEQLNQMRHHIIERNPVLSVAPSLKLIVEWQRIMFYAPEPEIPEEVKDLLWSKGLYSGDKAFYEAIPAINESVVEAFRRGQKSEKR